MRRARPRVRTRSRGSSPRHRTTGHSSSPSPGARIQRQRSNVPPPARHHTRNRHSVRETAQLKRHLRHDARSHRAKVEAATSRQPAGCEPGLAGRSRHGRSRRGMGRRGAPSLHEALLAAIGSGTHLAVDSVPAVRLVPVDHRARCGTMPLGFTVSVAAVVVLLDVVEVDGAGDARVAGTARARRPTGSGSRRAACRLHLKWPT